jgi:hypothetical protein
VKKPRLVVVPPSGRPKAGVSLMDVVHEEIEKAAPEDATEPPRKKTKLTIINPKSQIVHFNKRVEASPVKNNNNKKKKNSEDDEFDVEGSDEDFGNDNDNDSDRSH